jgi:hypothetical protein
MNRDGLSKIRRTELLARLARLEQMISEQADRADFIRKKGWNAATADRRLELLVDSHKLYVSVLAHLSDENPGVDRARTGRTDPPLPSG